MPSGPTPATPAPAAPAPAPPAPSEPTAGPATREAADDATVRRSRVLARSQQEHFLASVADLQSAIQPAALVANGRTAIGEMSTEAAQTAVDTVVKPAVTGAALTKLTGSTGIGESVKRLFDKGALDKLGAAAVRPLVQERLDELTAMTADATGLDALTDDQKLARLASLGPDLSKLPDDLLGKRTYLDPAQKQKVLRARMNLADKKGAPNNDRLVESGRRMTASLLDAHLRELVEGDPDLVQHWTGTLPVIQNAALAAVTGSADVLAGLSAELTDQLAWLGNSVVNLAADIEGRPGLSEEELTILLQGLNSLVLTAREMVDDGGRSLADAVRHHGGLRRVALATAVEQAAAVQPGAEKAVRKQIGDNAAKYTKARKDTDAKVKADVQELAANPIGPRSALQTKVVEQARAEITASEDNATSKFRKVGGLLDKALPGATGSTSGGATSLDVVIQIPLPGTPAFMGVRLHVDADRSYTGGSPVTTVGAQLGLQAGGKLPVAASLLGELGGYFTASGTTAAEAMEYVSYALFRRFRESAMIPREVTDAFWGAGGSTATKGQAPADAKTAEADAWGAGMESRLGANKDHAAETGGYARVAATVGTEAMGKGLAAKGAATARSGTKYSGATIEAGRAAGGGQAAKGRGAQATLGQARRSVVLESSVTAGTFGGSITAIGSWAKDPGAGGYAFQGISLSLSGSATAPTKNLLDGSSNQTATISKWVMAALGRIKAVVFKMEEKERTEIEGMSGVDKKYQAARAARLLYSVNEGTGAAAVERGWYEAVKNSATAAKDSAVAAVSSPGGGGPSTGLAGGVRDGFTTARKGVGTAVGAVNEGRTVAQGAVKGAATKVKDAAGLSSAGAVKLSGSLSITPDGVKLSFALGTESTYSSTIDVATITLVRTDNLVTVMLLPTMKVLV